MVRKQVRSAVTKAVQISGWLYGGTMLFYIVGRLFVGEAWTVIEIGSSLMPALLFPSFAFVPLAAVMKRWKLTLVQFPALCLFLILYAPFFLPKHISIPENTDRLHILTFILVSKNEDDTCILSLIRSTNADVIAIQELSTSTAQMLAAELRSVYPHQALHPMDIYAGGVGIFSQYPIVDDAYLVQLSLGGQRTRIQYDETEFTILNVHPTSPRVIGGFDSSLRSSEIDSVLEVATLEENAVLIVGDFNITDQTDDYRKISAQYGDAFRAVGTGLGPSFPNLGRFARPLGLLPPLLRIDYVFDSSHWTPIDAYVLSDSGGSDHYALYVELALAIED